MPSATTYTTTDNALNQAAQAEREKRIKQHAINWRYYLGNHDEYLKKSGKYNDNVILNEVRKCLDRTLSFLIPEFPHLKMPNQSNTDLEEWLWGEWRNNGGAVLLYNMATTAGLDGHGFAKIQFDKNSNIRIYNLDPSQILVYWDESNIENVLWYSLFWQNGRVQYRQDIVANERGTWDIFEYTRKGSAWELTNALAWDYELSPIVDWQHMPLPNEYYGEGELSGKINPQNNINKVASDISRIIRFHASPKTIVQGVEPDEVQMAGNDEIYFIPNTEGKAYNLEMQSDLTSSMNFLNMLIDDFQAQSRVVILSGDPAAFRGMTNLGVRTTFLPMINKNEILRRQYGYVIQAISQRILMLGGQDFSVPPDLTWKSPLPEDERETVTMVQQEMALGLMSKQTASAEVGLDYTEEQDKIADEQLSASVTIDGASVGVSG